LQASSKWGNGTAMDGDPCPADLGSAAGIRPELKQFQTPNKAANHGGIECHFALTLTPPQ
jgi:hypothetical protein